MKLIRMTLDTAYCYAECRYTESRPAVYHGATENTLAY